MNKKSNTRRCAIIHMPMSMIVRHLGCKEEKVVKRVSEVCKRGDKHQKLSLKWRRAAQGC